MASSPGNLHVAQFSRTDCSDVGVLAVQGHALDLLQACSGCFICRQTSST